MFFSRLGTIAGVGGMTIIDSSIAVGQIAYTTAGTYSWTAPAGVTSVSVVCVGGGGGGYFDPGYGPGSYGGAWGSGGGGLGYINAYPVTPGQTYSVVVGAGGNISTNFTRATNGGDSYFINATIVKGGGGQGAWTDGASTAGGTYVGWGGGNGGVGGQSQSFAYSVGGGGGGAGGYSGNGGAGGNYLSRPGIAGTGGGGGGGSNSPYPGTYGYGGAGGGVGLFGQGANGIAGVGTASTYVGNSGTAGSNGSNVTYGGGAGGNTGGNGGGAVRIMWPGDLRSFPSTYTNNIIGPLTLTTVVADSLFAISVAITAFSPVAVTGNIGTIIYSISPALPSGLNFNTSTGYISGTPSITGSTTHTITVTDLTNKPKSRTFSISVITPSQIAYTIVGSHSWTAPEGVTSVSVLCIGGGGSGGSSSGGGGGGGAVVYGNNLTVVPGQAYTVVVGAGGSRSYFRSSAYLIANAGTSGRTGVDWMSGGGGGAGGYSGAGGTGASSGSSSTNGLGGQPAGTAMSGGFKGGDGGKSSTTAGSIYGIKYAGSDSYGGGGGGGAAGSNSSDRYQGGGDGGGVGLLGQGTNGAGGYQTHYSNGFGGSGGEGGGVSGNAKKYGGGGGGNVGVAVGGQGAVRIIWPGNLRQFPSTNTADK